MGKFSNEELPFNHKRPYNDAKQTHFVCFSTVLYPLSDPKKRFNMHKPVTLNYIKFIYFHFSCSIVNIIIII